jgi:hypothetical protein
MLELETPKSVIKLILATIRSYEIRSNEYECRIKQKMTSLSVFKNLLNNSKRGIICFSKLLCKILGFAVNNETISEEETPFDRKN